MYTNISYKWRHLYYSPVSLVCVYNIIIVSSENNISTRHTRYNISTRHTRYNISTRHTRYNISTRHTRYNISTRHTVHIFSTGKFARVYTDSPLHITQTIPTRIYYFLLLVKYVVQHILTEGLHAFEVS
jgi:hypothetical protein